VDKHTVREFNSNVSLFCDHVIVSVCVCVCVIVVALSRVRSLSGLYLQSPFDPASVRADPAVTHFYDQLAAERASNGNKHTSRA
jgi:hypothetical protein